MVTRTSGATVVAIALDEFVYRQPDVISRIGALGPGQRLEFPASFDPRTLQQLVETLLPGTFAWEFGVASARGEASVAVTRL